MLSPWNTCYSWFVVQKTLREALPITCYTMLPFASDNSPTKNCKVKRTVQRLVPQWGHAVMSDPTERPSQSHLKVEGGIGHDSWADLIWQTSSPVLWQVSISSQKLPSLESPDSYSNTSEERQARNPCKRMCGSEHDRRCKETSTVRLLVVEQLTDEKKCAQHNLN